MYVDLLYRPFAVSTHSRLKAAGADIAAWLESIRVSTHSRLKAAGSKTFSKKSLATVSTHSRLKAAGRAGGQNRSSIQSFNTQPPEGGWQSGFGVWAVRSPFQHTAA